MVYVLVERNGKRCWGNGTWWKSCRKLLDRVSVSGINFLDHQLNSFVFLLWVGLYLFGATSCAPWIQNHLPLLVSLSSCVAFQFKPFKHGIMEFTKTSLTPGSFSTSSQVSGRISTPMSGQPATTLPEKTTGRAFQRPGPCESIDELELETVNWNFQPEAGRLQLVPAKQGIWIFLSMVHRCFFLCVVFCVFLCSKPVTSGHIATVFAKEPFKLIFLWYFKHTHMPS